MRPFVSLPALLLLVVSGCGICTPRSAEKPADCRQVWRVSLPALALDANERVIGIELRIINGRVTALNVVPQDWSLTVDPGYSFRSFVSGTPAHGSGALSAAEVPRDFVSVCALASDYAGPLSVEATLTTTQDFETTRRREVAADQIALSPSR